MFWNKIGTKTRVAASGTVEEITKFIDAKKPAMLYFSSRPINPDLIDSQQRRKLKSFRDEIYKSSLVGHFSSLEELKQNLMRDLVRQVNTMRTKRRSSNKDKVDQAGQLAALLILLKQHQITPEQLNEFRGLLGLARYSNNPKNDEDSIVTGLFFEYVGEVSATIDREEGENEWSCCVEICGENYETRKFEVVSIAVNQGFATAKSAIKHGENILKSLNVECVGSRFEEF